MVFFSYITKSIKIFTKHHRVLNRKFLDQSQIVTSFTKLMKKEFRINQKIDIDMCNVNWTILIMSHVFITIVGSSKLNIIYFG